MSTHELMTTEHRDAATTTNAASLMTGVGDAGARGLPAHRAAPACYWKVGFECPEPYPPPRPGLPGHRDPALAQKLFETTCEFSDFVVIEGMKIATRRTSDCRA